MHTEQIDFIQQVKEQFPEKFRNVTVLDVGSRNINGSNRQFFEDCEYKGLDIHPGPNVDIVCAILKHMGHQYDILVCGEMLEHSSTYKQDLTKMAQLVKPGGLLIITTAGPNRPKHNVADCCDKDNHYKNLDLEDFDHIRNLFDEDFIELNRGCQDLYFWGVKK